MTLNTLIENSFKSDQKFYPPKDTTSSPLASVVPMPDEAVKEAAAEIFQRPRLTNKERLAAECLKPRSVETF